MNHVYLPTTSLMTLVKTPFSTRVKVTAGWQKKTTTDKWAKKTGWLNRKNKYLCSAFLPRVASLRSPRSDFFRKAKTRITISGVKTATLWCRQIKSTSVYSIRTLIHIKLNWCQSVSMCLHAFLWLLLRVSTEWDCASLCLCFRLVVFLLQVLESTHYRMKINVQRLD